MVQSYIKQLRSDSSFALVPIITIIYTAVCLFVFAWETIEVWYLGVVALGSIITAHFVRRFLQQEKQELAGNVFVTAHLLLLTLIFIQRWQPGSFISYVYAIFIVISSTMIYPAASFYTWFWSALLMLGGLAVMGEWSIGNLLNLLSPFSVNLLLASASFLATMDWQIATESISVLQRRAQQRRDELFAIKEELSSTNARLQYLNKQLELARQEAIAERDLRTRFMNNVSHELRTPLNAIVNFAHILRLGGQGSINEQQTDYLERIEHSGWHLLSVLNDLLDMAQIESGQFKLHLEATNLYAICEEAMSSVRGLLLEKDVELIRDYPDEWPLVEVDRMRIKQALINLLGNATKYTEEGHIALRVSADEEKLCLVVEDTGVGIAPEHHELVFQEFRQIDESAARHRIGTGLGLPITRHLVERHGGEIRLDSDVGKGSRFTIILPAYHEEMPVTEAEKMEAVDTAVSDPNPSS